MNYEQKRLVVRVFLPGPMEKVTDWEAVARELYAFHDRYLPTDKPRLDFIIAKHTTTERPSRIDTGVDLLIHNRDDDDDGTVRVGFAPNAYNPILMMNHNKATIAALGFPTEPQAVVETRAEGEVMA